MNIDEVLTRFENSFTRVVCFNEDTFAPPRLYHYTGAAGVKGILLGHNSSGCSPLVLRATNFSFLNDPSEINYGRNLAVTVLEEKEKQADDHDLTTLREIKASFEKQVELSEVYVSCFTKLQDDLSQWRAYGAPKAPRYCIGFSVNYEKYSDPTQETPLVEVIYNEERQRQEIVEIIDRTIKFRKEFPSHAEKLAEAAAGRLARLLPVLKAPAYEAEKEWRIIRYIRPTDVEHVEFTDSPDVVRPYVLIKPEFSIVELLVLAPGREETSVKAAKMVLQKAKISDVQPKHSKMPFAEWF
jgi:hypothetical protein